MARKTSTIRKGAGGRPKVIPGEVRTTSFWIAAEQHRALRVLAAERDTTMSDLIRDWVGAELTRLGRIGQRSPK